MTERYTELAFQAYDPGTFRDLVANAFDLVFEERDSSFWGGLYWATPPHSQPKVAVHPNFEDEDGVLYIADHAEYTVMLFATGLTAEQETWLVSLGGRDLDTFEDQDR